MIMFTSRRLGYGLLVLGLVASFTFLTLRAIPGDVVRLQLADAPGATDEQVAQRAAELGLDQPVLSQFLTFMSDLVRLDFGTSFEDGRPVLEHITERLPATLELGLLALVLGLLLGIPLGVASALKQNSLLDQAMRILAVVGMSVPNFWLALLLITFLAQWFGWSAPLVYASPGENLGQNLTHLALPAFALAVGSMAGVARMLRSSMLEVLGSNFIRTVRARGASEWNVLFKHAGRNSLIPVFSLLGLQVGSILGGTVILESIFSIPGMGSLIFDAVQQRDYPVVLGCVIVYGGLFILVNLIVDVLYAIVDPRIRY
ncbi:ABC transporter permease [Aeromicrobium duanguangcaii]|uniref:ABC transporter permease n=1 Tax=Aeromicrobium duanguangcaii TaxID=2968086 RepID=A0ABY5KDA6_9ACTN|nr:ABC transporter permease [Aeromicrobium duanguangcaii]MCD9154502.1 ABC transporter permease [Aeromicrobium duanguangcaii]MCL3838250.1 ABC transporter permease [Aeromicrobium duanguangcaii]UUI68442.1 ABC transporter permease [Aeromicrobium duanguangcaii]